MSHNFRKLFSTSKGRCICGQLDHLLHSCPQHFPFLHKTKFASISYPHPKQYSFYTMKIQEIFLITRRRHVFLMDHSLVVCLSTSGMESQSFSASWQIRRCHLNVSIYSLSVLWVSFIFDILYWFFCRACDGKLVVHCFTQLPTSLLE